MPPFFCLWNPESPRAVSFTGAAFARLAEWPAAIAWADYLQGTVTLPVAARETIVRIDSPGRNWTVEKLLLMHGAELAAQEAFASLSQEEIAALPEDPGRILASRQKHLGFCQALQNIQHHFESKNIRWMHHPEDIVVMCDKDACQSRLAAAGISISPALGIIMGFDDLITRMDAAGRNRVFIKLCHGSSASGTVALERSVGRMQAFSTAKLSEGSSGTVLHNWRAISRYTDLRDIRRLVDAVCRHRACAEVWLPKAGWKGRRLDVRIVVIAGQARHVVARMAEGPFTNLQFGALRATGEELRDHIGLNAYAAMCQEAERAMACFPRSLYGGVDVLLDAHHQRPHILEVNAFGDLLPTARHEGRSTYDWEIAAMTECAQVSTTGR